MHHRVVFAGAPCWLACTLVALALAACGDDDGPRDASSDGSVDRDASDVATPDAGPARCYELDDGRCVEETFANPPVLQPGSDGIHRLDLAPTEVDIGGRRHCVRAYNGGFVAPTIETPAREGSTPRSVRVDLANRLRDHDYRSLEGGSCTCRTAAGDACVPDYLHDRCIPPDEGVPCVCTNEDGEVCEHMFDFNVTNLHAHGSHVRPDWARGGEPCEAESRDGVMHYCRECGEDVCDGSTTDDTCFHGDNVLNAVHPGTGARYRWDIDEDGTHHTGLQWYHPHIHGTTAMQVASGAAGAWIVRGPLDELDGIANARERVMIFSTPPIANDDGFTELPDGEVCDESTITFNDFVVLGAFTAGQLDVINGTERPRMITAPDQVERWRILQTGFLDEVFLGLFRGTDSDCSAWSTDDADTMQLTQIGRDGIILPQPFEHPYVFMSPGYRVEAMLGGEGRLRDGETWCLVAARFLQEADPGGFGDFGGEPFSPLEPPTSAEVLARFDSGIAIAILNVTASAGPATETSLPDYDAIAALAPSMDLDGVPIDRRCSDAAAVDRAEDVEQGAVLQVGFWTADVPDPCECPNYNVNCRNFETTDRSLYPFDRDLPLDAVEHWRVGASFDGHPFHIHINPFIVCPNDNVFDPLPFPHWRDTYLVNVGRSIDLITQNRAFTGSYVMHCHKLTHEDHGMMELIRVCDPAADASCGEHHWRACVEGDADCLQARA
ncbi:MAG: multicopper oxidase domain-containing protein, partial [Deltaproteobacteria bacterium]|nr:multicopper oxidase domain-containing protein [Deltaproteobacteria bacterium]